MRRAEGTIVTFYSNKLQLDLILLKVSKYLYLVYFSLIVDLINVDASKWKWASIVTFYNKF